MKISNLKKLARKADRILEKEEEKKYLIMRICEAGLIKKPYLKKHFLNWPTKHCPECGHEFNHPNYAYLQCSKCDYAYYSFRGNSQ